MRRQQGGVGARRGCGQQATVRGVVRLLVAVVMVLGGRRSGADVRVAVRTAVGRRRRRRRRRQAFCRVTGDVRVMCLISY